MACVTLKRPIDVLGSPHLEQQPLPKRKRCGPPLFPLTPSPSRGLKRAKRLLELDEPNGSPVAKPPSPFLAATPPLQTGN